MSASGRDGRGGRLVRWNVLRWALGAWLLILGCKASTTVLLIDVRTDLVAGAEFAHIRTDVYEDPTSDRSLLTATQPARSDRSYLNGVRVAEFGDLAKGRYYVLLRLLQQAGAIVVERRVVVELTGPSAVTVVITRDCRGVECGAAATAWEATCLAGQCGSPTCTMETPESCPRECQVDLDCPIAATCATGRCRDGVCVAEPTAECGGGEFCSPELDCVPLARECSAQAARVAQVAPGHHHSCAVREDPSLWCWGAGGSGQLGQGEGDLTDHLTPARVNEVRNWTSVAAGSGHTCAIDHQSELFCWGQGSEGQLGMGLVASSPMPARVGAASDWTSVATRRDHTCGIRSNGTLWCWGLNRSLDGGSGGVGGQLGVGDAVDRDAPTEVGTSTAGNEHWNDWVQVSLGKFHTCGLRREGLLYCWGISDELQLGTGTNEGQLLPTPTAGPQGDWVQVEAGNRHACARRQDGTVYCWGSGLTAAPGLVEPGAAWVDVTCGNSFTCGLQADASLWCWGVNALGQLGLGDTTDRAAPARVGLFDGWRDVTGGDESACAIDSSGQLFCWGSNDDGDLGLGDRIEGRWFPTATCVEPAP